MLDLIIKRFNDPDEVRVFEKGRFELLMLPGMTIGKATYKPGWIWSKDVSPLSETEFCNVEHLGMVLEGSALPSNTIPRCSTLQNSVSDSGDTSLDHIHPGLYVAFPMVIPGSIRSSNLPFSKTRTSSGSLNLLMIRSNMSLWTRLLILDIKCILCLRSITWSIMTC